MANEHEITLIITDDSKEDFELMKLALDEVGYTGKIVWLSDGEELINFLENKNSDNAPLQGRYLILLDINMPKKNGIEALEYIKTKDHLRSFPCVMLTTSQSPFDVQRSYELGANSFLNKPFEFSSMIELFDSLKSFWLEKNLLPEF